MILLSITYFKLQLGDFGMRKHKLYLLIYFNRSINLE